MDRKLNKNQTLVRKLQWEKIETDTNNFSKNKNEKSEKFASITKKLNWLNGAYFQKMISR